MNKVRVMVALAASSFFVQPAMAESFTDYAHILSADPVFERVEQPVKSKTCRDEVRETRTRKGDGGGAALVGAIVGGVIGHEMSRGQKDRDTATAVGAVIGAAVGNNAARGASRKGTAVETKCEVTTQYVGEEELVGYDVEYMYAGNTYTTRMDHDPGRKLKIMVSVTPVE